MKLIIDYGIDCLLIERKKDRKKSAPVTESLPIFYHYEWCQTVSELPRSVSSVSFQLSSSERSKSKGLFGAIRRVSLHL